MEKKLVKKNLYYEDYFLVLSKIERETIKNFSKIFWYSIFAVSAIFLIIGINFSLSSKFIISIFIENNFVYALFWIGVFLLLYSFHHIKKSKSPRFSIKELPEEEFLKKQFNLRDFMGEFLRDFIEICYEEAKNQNISLNYIIFKNAIKIKNVSHIFSHLEVNIKNIEQKLEEFKNNFKKYENEKKIFEHLQEILKEGFFNAYNFDDNFIELFHIILVVIDQDKNAFDDIFLGENITNEDVKNAIFYDKLRKKYSYLIYRKKPRKIIHKYMDLALTAKPTYFLDRFSYDLTDLARTGLIGFIIGHREEIDELINILNLDEKNNAILMGPAGIGKTTIIENLAYRVFTGRVPGRLKDKRVVALDTGAILSGIKAPGELQERLSKIRDEIISAKNLILAIPDLHDLARAGSLQAASLSSFFGPIFQAVDFPIVATTDEVNFHKFLEPEPEVVNNFQIIKIREISKTQAVKLCIIEGFKIEAKEGIVVSYFAIREAVEIASKYIHNQPLPGKAINLLRDSVETAKSEGKRILTKEIVKETFSKLTGIPIVDVKTKEKEILLNLEKILHRRMINQDQAVKAVAEALREARTGLSREKGPIGVFLFVGPTGVGKTEMAKTLASYYFGGEDKMLRFDMSEYQAPDSIYRLIGYKGQGGFLTEKVKQNPFSLILLDEFEKANRDVLNIFLQVFDDGRLTDELGNVVDFTNTIIIATSNAHSVLIKEELEKGKNIEEIKKLLKERLTDYFKPELINRFDEVIIFKPLSQQEIEKIALLQISRLLYRLDKEKGIKIKITNKAISEIARIGFDKVYGARPLRNVIRKKIKNLISLLILKGKLERGKHYILDFSKDKGFFIKEEEI